MAQNIYGDLAIRSEKQLQLFEAPGSGTNYVALKAASSLAGNVVWTLPAADAAGFMKSDGAGNLSLVSLASSDVSDFDEAAQDAVGAILATSGDVVFSYDDATPQITATLGSSVISGQASATVASGDEVLISDVDDSGNLKKVTAGAIAALATVDSFKATWVTADTATKAITHSLGTTDVKVEIFDVASGETIYVDSVVRTDANTVTVTASEAPPATDWRVLILAV